MNNLEDISNQRRLNVSIKNPNIQGIWTNCNKRLCSGS